MGHEDSSTGIQALPYLLLALYGTFRKLVYLALGSLQ